MTQPSAGTRVRLVVDNLDESEIVSEIFGIDLTVEQRGTVVENRYAQANKPPYTVEVLLDSRNLSVMFAPHEIEEID